MKPVFTGKNQVIASAKCLWETRIDPEKTVAETAHDDEVESLENEGESAWGKDEGPWEG